MSIELKGFSEIPPQETPETNIEEAAKKELSDLGIETSQENIEALMEQQKTQQHPAGYESLLASLDKPDELKLLMEEGGIKSIVHSEGLTVWNHVKSAIQEIESMDIANTEKAELKLIMLYHDLGKTTAMHSERNIKQTKKKLEKGELHQAMIGHHKEKLSNIEAGFRANNVDKQRLRVFMTVVENHMNTSLLEQDPKKTVKLFTGFGDNDEKRKKVVKLLTLVLQTDGNATQRIGLVDGELKYSKNDKKLKLDFDSVWEKYEEGKKILQQEIEKNKKKNMEAELEVSIFGKKLTAYLIRDRKIKPGLDIGKSIGKIKGIIAKNKNLSSKEIKELIDETEL